MPDQPTQLEGAWCARCENAWWVTADGRLLGIGCTCTEPEWFDLVAMAPEAQRVDITLVRGSVVSAHQHNRENGSDYPLPLPVQSSAPGRWEVFPSGYGVAILVHPTDGAPKDCPCGYPSDNPCTNTETDCLWAETPRMRCLRCDGMWTYGGMLETCVANPSGGPHETLHAHPAYRQPGYSLHAGSCPRSALPMYGHTLQDAECTCSRSTDRRDMSGQDHPTNQQES